MPPTQDLIHEFRVTGSAVRLEYGGFSGCVIRMSTKSGGNAIHGSACEYYLNTHLNTNSLFNNAPAQLVPPHHNHPFGASAGVRIYDPVTTCGRSGTPACAAGAPPRTPFPDNRIPSSRIDSFESNMVHTIKFLALPNTHQSAGNYITTSRTRGWSNQDSARRFPLGRNALRNP